MRGHKPPWVTASTPRFDSTRLRTFRHPRETCASVPSYCFCRHRAQTACVRRATTRRSRGSPPHQTTDMPLNRMFTQASPSRGAQTSISWAKTSTQIHADMP